MDAWDEAFKWNEEASRVKGKELASLMALKMIHTVSSLLFPLQITISYHTRDRNYPCTRREGEHDVGGAGSVSSSSK